MTLSAEAWRIKTDREALGRVSATERVADVLREHIIEGALLPGMRLSEEALREAIPVSRNTLREAFRLLSHERLLVHRFNRGVFVREPDVPDVRDIYRLRRTLECPAVREAAADLALDPARAALSEAVQAARDGRWREVGTANMHFHRALTALAGSPRTDEIMRRLMAEGRLAFHVVGSFQELHQPYLAWNREILGLMERGDGDSASQELCRYLDSAERQLIAAYHRKAAQGAQRTGSG